MRHVKTLLPVLMGGILFTGCDPCGHLECASDNYGGQFRIVSAADGSDLVFGPDKVYDKNAIRFYSLKGTDTTFFNYQPIRFRNIGYDSVLYVWFYPRPDTAYMRLGNGDVDTLGLSYRTHKGSRCCRGYEEIASFRLNNTTDVPGSQGTQELKK